MNDQIIGRYIVEREILRGGMAVVYLARDPLVKRRVAIKVLSPKLAVDDDYLARFQREAEMIASLEHANIAPVYDFGEHEGQPYIVMRYMTGGSLKERFATGPMKLTELAPIIKRVADALQAAHSRNIIHRDLKPGNILFDAKGDAFLADFGIAKMVGSATNEDLTGDSILGTPKYLSPEQVRGKSIDGRADIYSLGVVAFQALTGRVPFSEATPMATALAHLMEPIPNIQEINPELPAGAQEIINKAMAKEPGERYQKPIELARDVSDLASGRWFLLKL